MSSPAYSKITNDGLWTNNPALVQLLGLCPLLAVSNTVVNALGLGLATTLTLIISNSVVSGIRHAVKPEIRLPAFVLVIAATVTVIELLMGAWLHDLYLILGIFIPLIVTNCSVLARAEGFASKNDVARSALDGLMMGLGFTAVLVVLGALREVVGTGTLFSQFHLLFGEAARNWTITVIDDYRGFLLAILPPGAFIFMGLLIALKNIIDKRRAMQAQQHVLSSSALVSES